MLLPTLLLLVTVTGTNSEAIWSWSHESSNKSIKSVLKEGFDARDTSGQFGIGADDSLSLAKDPKSPNQYVLRVFYKKGSYSGSGPHRGAQFYGTPQKLDGKKYTSVTLEYEVFFQSGFGWKEGGKLPGLWGGTRTCSGGRKSETCFSTRLMWRSGGAGEVYAYVTHNQTVGSWSKFCDMYKDANIHERVECTHDNYGIKLGSGSFHFKQNEWTKIKQTVELNSKPGQPGTVKLWVDGSEAVNQNKVVIRNKFDFGINGLFFSTFYGGHSKSWACPSNTYTYFRNFSLSTD